ncbi:MAG TPA: 4Fe-4S binding protein, partial [Candidatus Kapabacteria bacterium]|nr:4Fe-4S binding protein [Candidatus Kapabacteria bacterium]
FAINEKKAEIIERDACMECGACAQNCPFQAITIRSGVGCAYGIIRGLIQGTEPSCDCDCGPSDCC